MDFYNIVEESTKTGIKVYPNFQIARSKDLMVRAKSFHAIWDPSIGMWSTNEFDVARLVDADLKEARVKIGPMAEMKWMRNFSSSSWRQFRSYMQHLPDNSVPLDRKIVFANQEVAKEDYASKKLPYPLAEGDTPAYEEIMSTLYDPEEREKLEWAIGAVIAGDSSRIQKFMVLYGESGTGKSTYLNIVQKLFEGYWQVVDADALVSASSGFATAQFSSNPLVALQHDTDLSKVTKNSLLNSIVSHETILINEKFKAEYPARLSAFLFVGTNKPVKITDAKSGLIRRLIDVVPSGRLIPTARYHVLVNQIDFELPGIAHHCLEVYRRMGKDYYSDYRSNRMMLETDTFYNFVEHNYDLFREQDSVTLKQAWLLYKQFVEEASLEYKLPMHRFRTELMSYFHDFKELTMIDGERRRSVYSGFLRSKFEVVKHSEEKHPYSLVLDQTKSLVDGMLADCPAQYSRFSDLTKTEIPNKRWDEVTTVLSDLDTTRIHYVKPPENHIVIDFDLRGDDGEKSIERNLQAASSWPPTYAEFSQGGAGVHLHYLYEGDVSLLSRIFGQGIEIKVFSGMASLRRRLSRCNGIPVATLSSGLPLKEERVIDFDGVKSEKSLRNLIERNLRKEIHPGTKPSIDFIHKILKDAYSSDLVYDLTDMRPLILSFAARSTNQSAYCIKLVSTMKFRSEITPEESSSGEQPESPLVFFDLEVFPNLLHISWKYQGEAKCVRMVNPKPKDIEKLLKMRLVGFNNRRYDNHILYAAWMGYSNEELHQLSKAIIEGSRNAMFGAAYDLSYADIYDFASIKKSLKKWQIDLKIFHKELGLPWDQPVPEELWETVAEYCDNDVISTEVVFEDREQDFVARQILADLSGLSVNNSTLQHTAKIIFEGDRRPQDKFIYTDLSTQFEGYVYDYGKSTYRDEEVGEGGYVYAEPGMYTNVSMPDVASMHPTSIELLDLFGPYTENFSALKKARLAIKRKDYDGAKKMLGGIFAKYLRDESDAEALSYALKIVINTVYGLTSAKFDNPFRDRRNKDNIVAKRGALFMIDLKHAVQELGYPVVHIKTDSIKIPNATPEVIQFVKDFGAKYGYEFEFDPERDIYERMCLVNDAVYIARKPSGKWEAVGAQFAHPYVFKYLFSKEALEFDDLCETKTVTTALYLQDPEDGTEPVFVGKAGRFCPIKPGRGGRILLREKDGKFSAATGTKGHLWMEAEQVKSMGKEDDIDIDYFLNLVESAKEQLGKHGDVDWFLSAAEPMTQDN